MPTTRWRKSSYSQDPASDCVEVAFGPGAFVRDSKNGEGPVLAFGVGAWRQLIATQRPSAGVPAP
jgi:hypothetical protein